MRSAAYTCEVPYIYMPPHLLLRGTEHAAQPELLLRWICGALFQPAPDFLLTQCMNNFFQLSLFAADLLFQLRLQVTAAAAATCFC